MIRKNQTSVDLDKADQTGDITANHCKKKKKKKAAILEYDVPLVFKYWQDCHEEKILGFSPSLPEYRIRTDAWKLQEGSFQFNFILKRF